MTIYYAKKYVLYVNRIILAIQNNLGFQRLMELEWGGFSIAMRCDLVVGLETEQFSQAF